MPGATLGVQLLLVVAVSLAGGLVPGLLRLTHRRMEVLVSFVSGVMLGAAVLQMLPHACAERAHWLEEVGSVAGAHDVVAPVALWMLAGFLAMFFVERFFCFHHHDVEEPGAARAHAHAHAGHELTWTGAAVGLSLHSLMDGVALGAAVSAARGEGVAAAAGLGTFLAVLLHKPFDSMTLATLMVVGRTSSRARRLGNVAYALMVPAGAVLFLAAGSAAGEAQRLVSAALALAAGTFLCISLSDLLPELQFHRHDRVKLSAALLLGVAVAWGAGALEERGHDAMHLGGQAGVSSFP
jgi:zinc and cadmium transporter